MFKNKLIRYSTFAMLVAVLAYFFIENFSGNSASSTEISISNPQAYLEKINSDRESKDELFRSGPDSPILDKDAFHGLHYFKPNLEYRVVANVVPYTGSDKVFISVLFRDETSGKETYGGGRYLDYPISELKNNTLILDFNEAYNPYCAYQEDYACPVPPKENTLPLSIFAGEQYEEAMH